jgi:AsmA protein
MTGRPAPRPDHRAPRTLRGERAIGRRRWIAAAGYGFLGLACVVVATATFLLLVAAPDDFVRDRLVQQVKARTSRDLAISGSTSVSLFPRVAVSLTGVSLSAPPAMGGEPTVVAERLDVEVGLFSLLSRQVAIRRLVLTRPTIELRIDAQGRRTWEFAELAPRPIRLAQLGTGVGSREPSAAAQRNQGVPGTARLAAALETLMPASVRIVDGTVRYADERVGTSHEIGALDLDLTLDSLAGPLEGKGSLGLRGEKIAFQASLSPMRALLQEKNARLSLKVNGRPIEAAYDGTAGVVTGGLALEGKVSVKAPSLAALGGWLAKPSSAERDAVALSLASQVSAADGRVSLPELTATIGDTTLSGALAVDTRGAPAHVSGALSLSALDLGRLLTRSGGRAAAPSRPPIAETRTNAIDDLLKRQDATPPQASSSDGRADRGGGRRDWGDDIIDLTPLGLADADLTLSAERIVYKHLASGPARLKLVSKSRIAKLTLEEMLLYGGRGRGVLTLDASGEVPVTGADLTLEGVSASPLLKDALGFDWLEGRSTITVALAGQGASERQIVETLNGKVETRTANGTLTGIDVAKLLQAIEQGRLTELGIGGGEKTQFSELAATFVVAAGMARNQDLRLVSPRLRVAGEGTINLAQRQLDYTVHPKIVGGIAAPGAVINVKNLDIPVRVEGPWEKPAISVKGQEQIAETLKQVGKNLKTPEVQEAIKNLLGGGEGQERVKPRELLEKLLKKQ